MIRRALSHAATVLGALALVAFAVWGVSCQFQVYRKKHGPQMTFWDFLIDSERK